jgi:hypothetical protein
MKTKIAYFVKIIFFLFLTSNIFGQTICQKSNILGNWIYVNSYQPKEPLNVDSLVQTSKQLKQKLGTCSFNSDGTYYMTSDAVIKHKSKGYFRVFEDNCEIRLGKKEKTPIGLIFHILFLNNQYLILKCSKPKGNFVYIYKRN